VTGAGVVIFGVCLLIILMLIVQFNFAAPEEEDDPEEGRALPVPSTEARIERYIGLLNYGDDATAAEAIRHILSMGPSALPILLKQINRLEHRTAALSPRCQLRLEELLTAFGLVTYLECGEMMRYIHRASPVFPSMVRVVSGIGPNLVVEIVRNPILDAFAVVAPLLRRMGPRVEGPLGELLAVKAGQIPEELLLAAIPVFVEHPSILTALLGGASAQAEVRLVEVLSAWGLAPMLEHFHSGRGLDNPSTLERAVLELTVQAFSRLCAGDEASVQSLVDLARLLPVVEQEEEPPAVFAVLAALPWAQMLEVAAELGLGGDDVPGKSASEADSRRYVEDALAAVDSDQPWRRRLGVRALGQVPHDPRAVERLIALARDSTCTVGSLALVELVRHERGPLDDLLAARVRAAELTDREVFYLRLAVMHRPDHFLALLGRLLRADSVRVVSVAAVLLASIEPPLPLILKALGRHRYSPMEMTIAPLFFRQWVRYRGELAGALLSEDREVRQGAVDLLGGFGGPEHVPAILARVVVESDMVDSLLNAVELIGPDGAAGLAAFVAESPEVARNYSLERRLSLLRPAVADPPAVAPHPAPDDEEA